MALKFHHNLKKTLKEDWEDFFRRKYTCTQVRNNYNDLFAYKMYKGTYCFSRKRIDVRVKSKYTVLLILIYYVNWSPI